MDIWSFALSRLRSCRMQFAALLAAWPDPRGPLRALDPSFATGQSHCWDDPRPARRKRAVSEVCRPLYEGGTGVARPKLAFPSQVSRSSSIAN